jgi:hypothetical protein
MYKIYDLFGNITDPINAQVAWLSNIALRNLDWMKLRYKRYRDFRKTLDCSGRLRKIIQQHDSAQQRTTPASNKQRDLWQQYPELLEIRTGCRRIEKWI